MGCGPLFSGTSGTITGWVEHMVRSCVLICVDKPPTTIMTGHYSHFSQSIETSSRLASKSRCPYLCHDRSPNPKTILSTKVYVNYSANFT